MIKLRRYFYYLLTALSLLFSQPLWAAQPIKITIWHAMAGGVGDALNQIIRQFNASQQQYQVIGIYKGDYNQTLTAGVAAFRAHQQPDIIQVFEIGTATMTHPAGIIKPVSELMRENHIAFNEQDILPPIRAYYSDSTGQLLAMPFNSSSPVMFYNQDAFKKAGLDPNQAPRTWPEMKKASLALIKAGYSCGFTTGWPSWIQLENFSAWHNVPFATQGNGFVSTNAELLLTHPVIVRHIQTLAEWQKQRIFVYGGRSDNAMSLFTSQTCPMLMESSGSVPDLVKDSQFKVKIAPLPYWPDVAGAPQNTSIGGAALWAFSGHDAQTNKGIAEFFAFLAQPKIAAQWQQATGYLPVTQSAYQLSLKQGFYQKNPGSDVAVKELLNKKPTPYSQGFRLGNFMRIRELNEQALESIWSNRVSAQVGLELVNRDDNELLKQFARNTNIH